MKERKVIVACLIVIVILGVILGGFAYAYINKLNTFNQTKSYFQSLGYDISIVPFSTPPFSAILPIVDVASFISIARQNNITTIFEGGYRFIFIVSSTEYEYTPNNSIWWIWG
jgi:hypothetical protein